MNIFELTEELAKKSKEEIQYAIFKLMTENKIDFLDINTAYVKFLEHKKEDMKDRLIEANTSIASLLTTLVAPKSKKQSTITLVNNAIHRALYNLNTSRQFNMQTLNERYQYNEETDKHLSWYWREHNNK